LPNAIAAALRAPYVVLQVPSLVRYKQWPLAHYVSLVRSLVDEGVQVVLTGGPSPRDRAMVTEVAEVAPPPGVLDAGGQLDLNQMTTLLSNAAVYVGPDTSITHLAAACGIPVVALYGPIDPRLWGPWPQGSPLVAPYERRVLDEVHRALQGTH
jgi:heptosyltransferase-3